jgi:hypothetical protein
MARRDGARAAPHRHARPAVLARRPGADFPALQVSAGSLQVAITPVAVDGRNVATLPRNPAQAAAEQQEIAEATRTAGILGGMFPEEWKMNVDGRATMEAWLKKSRVSPELIVMRDKGEVAKAVDQMAKLAGARHVGDPGDATGGQGAV